MTRAMQIPATTASTPAPSAASRAFIVSGTYQIIEDSAPKTAAPVINQNLIGEA